MKNILQTLPLKNGKLNFLDSGRTKSKQKDSLYDSIKLESFRSCNEKIGAEKTVYDCNSNQVVTQPTSFRTIKRAKTWSKGISTKIQDISSDIRSKSLSFGENIETENLGQHLSSIQETVEQVTRRSSRKLKKHLRTVSDNITTLTRSKSVEEIIDYGRCYCPTEMNYKIMMEKLAAKKRNLSFYMRNRSLSDTLKEPAKKFINNNNIYKKSKSTESTCSDETDYITDSTFAIENTIIDVSRSRESIYIDMNYNQDISFSSNVWYYGQLNMQFVKTADDSATFSTSVLARVDKHGEVMYSLTYENEADLCVGAFPFDGKRYCLDFLDPNQPRFISIKYLLAYLIEQKVLQRVSFAWLIDNCDS